MPRTKRAISPEAESSSAPKRVRLQQMAQEEVIVIDGSASTLSSRRKNAVNPPSTDDDASDVEIIEDPTEIANIKKWKGKSKATSVSPRRLRSTKSTRSTRVIHDVEAFDEAMAKDAAMARRMAMEWAAEPAQPEPQPHAGPSRQGAGTKSSDDVVVVESSTSGGKNGAANASTPSATASSTKASPKPASLDLPYITLPNPELALEEIKALLTTARPCSKCGEALEAPHTRDFKFVLDDPDITKAALRTLLHLPCSNEACDAVHCRGCFKVVNCWDNCRAALRPSGDCQVLHCCKELRAIALYEALSAFDRKYLEDRASAEARTKELNVKNRSASGVRTVGPGGTGYAAEGGEHGFDMEFDEFDEEDYSDLEGEFDDLLDGEGFDNYADSKEYELLFAAGLAKAKARAQIVQAPEPEPEPVLSESDQALMQALSLLTDLLPAPYANEPEIYDYLPHPSLGALLLMSFIPTVLADLLRNDSVTDWIARNQIYHAMLTLLKRMGDSELTVPVLVGHRPVFNKACSLDEWMWGQGQFSWVRSEDGDVSMASPLLEHFKKLKRQAETFLQTTRAQFRGTNSESNDPSFVVGVSLCSDIVSAQDDIKKAMEAMHQAVSNAMDVDEQSADVQATYGQPETNDAASGPSASTRSKRAAASKSSKPAKGKGKGKGKAAEAEPAAIEASSFDLEKEYIASCEKLSFEYVSFPSAPGASSSGQMYQLYKFAPELQQTQNATRIPKARLHFAKELAVMATSLPPGIWVRIDEVRNDAIKVMIAGPQGTPYAGGLFEFDCFIPLEYPNRPPLMHLRTTGGGTVRFNPNLYNCGKVCLSLLGTWSGTPEEQWTSKSTLLQVLVSIQSMILNEAPYYNEPGTGRANLTAQRSIDYNRDVSLQTVRWAMVEWLKDEHRDGIWKDVIKSHFTLRKEKIQQQIAAWAKQDPRVKAYTGQSRGRVPLPILIKAKGKATAGGTDPFSNLRLPPAPTLTKGAMNLVEEFEDGMQRVEAWPSEG